MTTVELLTKTELAFVLMVTFQIKHFIADFPLQNRYMLQKTRPDWLFLPPLALHSATHAGMTLGILLAVKPDLWWMAFAGFILHFAMDRVKAGPRYLGRWTDVSQSKFWIAFGFDQMFHHLTHLWIIWTVISGL